MLNISDRYLKPLLFSIFFKKSVFSFLSLNKLINLGHKKESHLLMKNSIKIYKTYFMHSFFDKLEFFLKKQQIFSKICIFFFILR